MSELGLSSAHHVPSKSGLKMESRFPRLLWNRPACYLSLPVEANLVSFFDWGPHEQFSIKETIGPLADDLQVKSEQDG
jgi:hypothetical protein